MGREKVFIDESGFAHDMPRVNGHAPVGERCVDKKDWHAKGRMNAIGALIGMSLITVSLFVGSINADTFYSWIIKDLLPKLPKNCVIVMDNATFHKRHDIIQAIQNAGHILEYLPPYSPDLNPIEHKWAQIKSIRRKEKCSIEEVFANHV